MSRLPGRPLKRLENGQKHIRRSSNAVGYLFLSGFGCGAGLEVKATVTVVAQRRERKKQFGVFTNIGIFRSHIQAKKQVVRSPYIRSAGVALLFHAIDDHNKP